MRHVREEIEDENVPRARGQGATAGAVAIAEDLAGRLDDQPVQLWLESPRDRLGHPGARRVLLRAERRLWTARTVAEQRFRGIGLGHAVLRTAGAESVHHPRQLHADGVGVRGGPLPRRVERAPVRPEDQVPVDPGLAQVVDVVAIKRDVPRVVREPNPVEDVPAALHHRTHLERRFVIVHVRSW